MATKKSTTSAAAFSDEERQAMKDHATEVKRSRRRGSDPAADAEEVLAKIADMGDDDRAVAEWVHGLILKAAPDLAPKLWYGMPAYLRDGKRICFFQPAGKFKVRYSTLGFDEAASLDQGSMWPTSYALTKVTKSNEAKIRALVKAAVS